ncbi:DUF4350 domain-containing protein [Neobacillus sp. MER 74]|uniref:DUF4350 domain-containing protein n=1 Tax=Neobacillus sp. MER 74 TaxID=2939566 RepID=UPI00203C5451|nr:DUF4350 domain-containing protein [Neobacillus sp. MER 74]MCM3115672.1 DUF4350 domain-containing protein [Neobacillus sp. MER 74]
MKSLSNMRTWIGLVILLGLFLLFSYLSSTPKPKYYPNYVSESPAPGGVKAFYTYVKKEIEGKEWRHSPDLLSTKPDHQLLIMVEPAISFETEEMKAYINYMKAGNTILLLQTNPQGMFDIKTSGTNSSESQKVFTQDQTSYRAQIHSTIRLQTKKGDRVLLSDQTGPISVQRSFGKGQLIVSITPEWMTNGNLIKRDHLPLLLYLLNEGKSNTILFDEYIHSGENAPTVWNVYPMWFLVLVIQMILLMTLWLWLKGKRFGPIFVPREESVRFSDEGLKALTAWYLRGRRYHDSIIIQSEYVKLLLQERWQIPYHREWLDLSSYMEKKRTRMSANEINSFLTGLVHILEKETITKQEFLLWSKRLEQLRKEVEE